MAGLLARLFRVQGSDKPFEVARSIDSVEVWNLPFTMEDCQFCNARFPVVSGVTTGDRSFLSYIQDFADDSENGLVVVSDYCRAGMKSLFLVIVGDRDTVREKLQMLVSHMDRIESQRLIVHGERPNMAAAAVQLTSLIPI